MPPFTTIMVPSQTNNNNNTTKKPIITRTTTTQAHQSDVVTLDVGGQLFQTTKQTLTQAGPNSLFTKLILSTNNTQQQQLQEPLFIDRDPHLFSSILSVLRTGTLPFTASGDDHLDDLISESRFYNVEELIVNALCDPSLFDAYNLVKSQSLPLNGRDLPGAVSSTPFGSLHVSHGSKITSFDWSLKRKSTVLTNFNAIDSLLAISPSLAAAGATDYSGLEIVDLEKGFVRERLCWENVTRSGSTVQAIGSNLDLLFTSFESGRRNSNCIMVYDLNTFLPVTEIGHYEIFGADLDSAIPATKLAWLGSYNVVMAAGSHSGISGTLGSLKLWDVRTGSVTWELKEKVDCFADITVSDSLSAIFKVGINSAEVSYMDLRKLGSESDWVCLGDRRKVVNVKKEGAGCKIEAHGNHVFRSKGGDIELWSEVLMGSKKNEDGLPERVFRKNLMGRVKGMGGSKITNLSFGGNKMFVTRKDQQSVEVWQSSVRGH